MWAICHTSGCDNEGIPIDVGTLQGTDEETGETYTIINVACGPCGQPITDLSETQPPMPEEEEQSDG